MQKPSKETIRKHVAKLRALVAKRKGVLPSYTWLESHGYFRSYEIMRQFPSYFKGIVGKRAFAR